MPLWVRSALVVGDRGHRQRIRRDIAVIALSNPELPNSTQPMRMPVALPNAIAPNFSFFPPHCTDRHGHGVSATEDSGDGTSIE